MILPDSQISKWCVHHHLIEPFDPDNVQPASIDLRLGRVFKRPHRGGAMICLDDVAGTVRPYGTVECDEFLLGSGEFILGTTEETVNMPNDLVGRIEGKSSLGRLGLIVHATAGYIDPGFRGKVTLEFFNLNPSDILLKAGLRIAQMSFAEMTHAASHPYGSERTNSKYQDQDTTTESRYRG